MALTGAALAPTRDAGSLRATWWRRPPVRFAVGVLVFAGVFALPYVLPPEGRQLTFRSFTLELAPESAPFWVGLLLMPFLRRVSYRRRDVLLVALVPIYGPMVAGLVVSRLIALPRRDWTPREDELPRVVRIPGGRGAYVLERTFDEAEALRTEWCRNPEHAHPYASWHEARTFFCRHESTD